ncbi:hypothetical protein AJ88_03755 [Mesorhizobium amorphae CCBAU 01583]|nr:hypothetical protein AJ88_03755 [Mesorhizobium amorphae CCBAU 01583]
MTVGQTLDDILRAYQALPPQEQKEMVQHAQALAGAKVACRILGRRLRPISLMPMKPSTAARRAAAKRS